MSVFEKTEEEAIVDIWNDTMRALVYMMSLDEHRIIEMGKDYINQALLDSHTLRENILGIEISKDERNGLEHFERKLRRILKRMNVSDEL